MSVFVAALEGDVASLRPHLPRSVNERTAEGYTPLSLAVSAGHVVACRLLLREGADVNAADDESGTTGTRLQVNAAISRP